MGLYKPRCIRAELKTVYRDRQESAEADVGMLYA